MGKAALDLPDPLQAPPQGAKTSTDELLAQLAGDEIDRLLAEADASQPPNSRAPFHVAPPPRPETEPEAAAEAAAPAPLASQPQEPPVPSSTTADVSAEMDALFSAAIAKDQPAEAAPGDDAAAAVAGAAAEAEAETTAAERAGLQPRSASFDADGSFAQPAPEPEADEDAPLPLYLRPLEWLNAPLALLPESMRDIVGKIAILTLLNAAAILTYVLVVRRGQ